MKKKNPMRENALDAIKSVFITILILVDIILIIQTIGEFFFLDNSYALRLLLVIYISYYLMTLLKSRLQKEKKEHTKKELEVSAVELNNTRDLFLETLTKMGCQYEIKDGEDNLISFPYQGEYFLVEADNGRDYITIYDLGWECIELYDIDGISQLRRAINEANCNGAATIVFTIEDNGKKMKIHSKSTLLFIPQIPNLIQYLYIELNEFFVTHQTLESEWNKLKEKEALIS